jgi:integrase/recombinase XerD
VLEAARKEPLRNRLMLALQYDGALRREELCCLESGDVDPAHRVITVRAETTKNRQGRVVPYSAPAGELYAAYLRDRRDGGRLTRGSLFVSASRRNRGAPCLSRVVPRPGEIELHVPAVPVLVGLQSADR